MNGSKRMTRERALEALRRYDASKDYVWDGADEGDRPLTEAELREGVARARRLGRPPGSNKESTTIRLDKEVLDAFRADGPGWQTRINAALREWLEERRGSVPPAT